VFTRGSLKRHARVWVYVPGGFMLAKSGAGKPFSSKNDGFFSVPSPLHNPILQPLFPKLQTKKTIFWPRSPASLAIDLCYR
jgi:hypothetical protein